jgi:uncharacterized protein
MRMAAIATVLLVLSSASVSAQQAQLYDDRPKISVNGEALVDVTPDRIILSFGIETSDKSVEVAKRMNTDILRKAVAAIKQCGVSEKDIQTDHLSIQPHYRDDYRAVDFIGYFVRNTFLVTLNKTGEVDELVSKVLAAGVTQIHGVDFQTTEYKKYREQARELALKAAKEKAQKMAAVLGESIGVPLQISETYSGMGSSYSSWCWGTWGWGRGGGMNQNVAQNSRGHSSEVSDTIALGKVSIRAAVSVTFELRK